MLILFRIYENATHSLLLLLPPEIRNRIYNYVLGGNKLHLRMVGYHSASGTEVKLKALLCLSDEDDASVASAIRSCHKQTAIPNTDFRERHPQCYSKEDEEVDGEVMSHYQYSAALLRTCSQIHAEAYLLPFHTNVFVIDNRAAFTAFITRIRPEQCKAISSMTIFRLRSLLEGVERDRRKFLKVKWSRQNLGGLRDVIVFEEVKYIQTAPAVEREEKLRQQREYFLKKLPLLTNANLTSVTVCAFHHDPTYVDPDLFNKHCESIEEMFLSLGKTISDWRKLKMFSDYEGRGPKDAARLWLKCFKAFATR